MADFAQDLPYWQTSKRPPDYWLDKAKAEIDRAGGEVLAEGFGSQGCEAAYFLRFQIGDDTFRIVWPVAEGKYLDDGSSRSFLLAARRQAATMLFHDVKAACVKARVLGARTAFFAHLELEDGSLANQAAPESLPLLLPGA